MFIDNAKSVVIRLFYVEKNEITGNRLFPGW